MNGQPRIRIAIPCDEAAVSVLPDGILNGELMRGAYAEDALANLLPVIARANPSLLASGTYFIAETDGSIVGCGGWTPGDPRTRRETDGVGHVRHVAVDPRCIRLGIGRAVMNTIAQTARSAGMRRLERLSSLNAVPFYRAVGYVPENTTAVTLSNGIVMEAVLMHSDL